MCLVRNAHFLFYPWQYWLASSNEHAFLKRVLVENVHVFADPILAGSATTTTAVAAAASAAGDSTNSCYGGGVGVWNHPYKGQVLHEVATETIAPVVATSAAAIGKLTTALTGCSCGSSQISGVRSGETGRLGVRLG